MTNTRFSVVIPAHRNDATLRRCLHACVDLAYPEYEVIVVSDRPIGGVPIGVRVLLTGAGDDTSPGEKRDLAFEHGSGEVFAFLDDDAYPRRDWLERAAQHFCDDSLTALGGPGLTPPDSGWAERLSGAVYESLVGSGPLRYRFLPEPARDVEDFPAYNFFVRRDALAAVGGWGTPFYGGEDTVLCLKLVASGLSIRYTPDVVVFHQRRRFPRGHLLQVANIGRHRGYFVRAYPATSRRVVYFLPALTPLVTAAAWAVVARRPRVARLAAAAAYAAVALESSRRHPASVAAGTPPAVIAHHLAYGYGFVRGVLTRSLQR